MNTAFLKVLAKRAQNVSPTALAVTGVVGVVAATVLACRATLKLEAVLDEHEASIERANELKGLITKDDKEFPYKEVVVRAHVGTALKVAKLYAGPVLIGVVSIAAISGGHIILLKRNAALGAALTLTEKAYAKYRETVAGEIGEEREKELRYGMEVEQVGDPKAGTVTDVVTLDTKHSPYARFFDESNINWERSAAYNKAFLTSQQDYANQKLVADGFLLLNDVYKALGFPRTTAGAVVGWSLKNGDGYVDFGIYDPRSKQGRMFVNGDERSVLLDFNVDGSVYHLIGDQH